MRTNRINIINISRTGSTIITRNGNTIFCSSFTGTDQISGIGFQ